MRSDGKHRQHGTNKYTHFIVFNDNNNLIAYTYAARTDIKPIYLLPFFN